MDMTFYHANADNVESGVLTEIIKADIEISNKPGSGINENSFSITVPEETWKSDPVLIGHRIYTTSGEWGGIVTKVAHSTEDASVTVEGPTWRGLLSTRYIVGTNGSIVSYANIDAQEAVRRALNSAFGSLITAAGSSTGVNVSAEWNCVTIAEALNTTLEQSTCRLDVEYSPVSGAATLTAAVARDWSNDVEISQDYGVHFTSTVGTIQMVNHCIAVSGDTPGTRTVINLYRIGDGNYTTTKPTGWSDAGTRSIIVNHTSNEDRALLIDAAIKALEEARPTPGSIKVDSIQLGIEDDIHLGDFIGVRDRLTGLTSKPRVVRKILTVSGADIQIKIEVA